MSFSVGEAIHLIEISATITKLPEIPNAQNDASVTQSGEANKLPVITLTDESSLVSRLNNRALEYSERCSRCSDTK
jgi:hypothetical protein